jgi:4-hydroxy-tetrahydrodipicolinate synthase
MTDGAFTGVGVALLTLFTDAGAVDVDATARHAEQLTELGVRAVLVAGTTGEADTLDDTEREELVTAVRERLPDHVPVIAGTSAAWTRAAADRAVAARKAGADAVLVHPPRGCPDLAACFGAVADALDGPDRLIGYHNPGPLGVPGIGVRELAELPIRGLKDSSGDPNRLLHELSAWDGAVYVGNAAIAGYAGPLGAAGAILALANVAPESCVAAFSGDTSAQRALTEVHIRVRENGLGALKQATADRFGTSPVRRLTLR